MRFVPSVYNTSESEGVAGVRFVKEGEADANVTVVFSTEDQQATGGEDFIVQSINVTTFAPSETERFAAVGIMEDNVYEGTESFLGLLTPGSRGVRIEGGPATINFRDNDG